MSQLYTVTVEVELQVWARDEGEAIDIGRRSALDELESAFIFANPTISLPRSWKTAIPYGIVGDQTCEMLMKGGNDG